MQTSAIFLRKPDPGAGLDSQPGDAEDDQRDEAAALCPQNGEMGIAVPLRPLCAPATTSQRVFFPAWEFHMSWVPGCSRGTVLSSDVPSSPPRTCPKEAKTAQMVQADNKRTVFTPRPFMRGIRADKRMEGLGRSADWPPKLGTNPHHLPTSSVPQLCRGNC